jgi:RNA polymerase sigma-70 factor, ECF subfamily
LRVLETGADEQRRVAAAQHDPALFADLYEQNFDRVYAYIARRVPTRQDTEDLTSEVFHEALRSLGQFEWRGLPFAAWLFGIASRLLANRWRKNGNRPETVGADADEIGLETMVEQTAMLAQLVEALPSDQRLVVRMRFIEQKNIREIAQELRRTEGAIKQLQFRALQTLRSRMGKRHV